MMILLQTEVNVDFHLYFHVVLFGLRVLNLQHLFDEDINVETEGSGFVSYFCRRKNRDLIVCYLFMKNCIAI
jgi:hypothetical protein